MLQIFCKNNKISLNAEFGTTLLQIYDTINLNMPRKPLCAIVNNQLEGLRHRVFQSEQVEFLDITSAAGRKVYMRSMTFVLYKAVEDLFPGAILTIEAPVSKGYYFRIHQPGQTDQPVTLEQAQRLKQRMQQIIGEGHRFHRIEAPTTNVAQLFRERGMEKKAQLVESLGRLYTTYYQLGQTVDYYYGPLVPSTDFLDQFDLVKYYDGLLLRVPRENGQMPEIIKQEKMLQTFREDHQLETLIGITTVGELNQATQTHQAGDTIKVAEALQEKKISRIADHIASQPQLRVILIAGPSSSGKTTFSKRLAVGLMVCGLKPLTISLDNYFVDRDKTPRDPDGQYDYEHIEAVNLPLFNTQLNQLLDHQTVTLPHYDFPTGTSQLQGGPQLTLQPNNILIIEGIHALNPQLTTTIPPETIYRIYVSALTTIKLDNHNYIPTTDNRLLRRIVRDNQFRGISAAETIDRWPSVRRGEDRWIFPYQENADVMFNSALIYELAVLRNHAIPLLETVTQDQPQHAMAHALTTFLRYFHPISDTELPPTSLLREFLGGSSFHY